MKLWKVIVYTRTTVSLYVTKEKKVGLLHKLSLRNAFSSLTFDYIICPNAMELLKSKKESLTNLNLNEPQQRVAGKASHTINIYLYIM